MIRKEAKKFLLHTVIVPQLPLPCWEGSNQSNGTPPLVSHPATFKFIIASVSTRTLILHCLARFQTSLAWRRFLRLKFQWSFSGLTKNYLTRRKEPQCLSELSAWLVSGRFVRSKGPMPKHIACRWQTQKFSRMIDNPQKRDRWLMNFWEWKSRKSKKMTSTC